MEKLYNVYLINLEENKPVDMLRCGVVEEVAEARTEKGCGTADYYIDYFEVGSDNDLKFKEQLNEK